MGFVQIIEYRTSKIDEMRKVGEEWEAAAGGQSQAGTTPNGGLRSYGSMTYAGLKSMIYAGVGPEDVEVAEVAGAEWSDLYGHTSADYPCAPCAPVCRQPISRAWQRWTSRAPAPCAPRPCGGSSEGSEGIVGESDESLRLR